jgi:hypothetical protein
MISLTYNLHCTLLATLFFLKLLYLSNTIKQNLSWKTTKAFPFFGWMHGPTILLLLVWAAHSPSHLPLHPPLVIHALTGPPHHPPCFPCVHRPVQAEAPADHPVNEEVILLPKHRLPTSPPHSSHCHFLICRMSWKEPQVDKRWLAQSPQLQMPQSGSVLVPRHSYLSCPSLFLVRHLRVVTMGR